MKAQRPEPPLDDAPPITRAMSSRPRRAQAQRAVQRVVALAALAALVLAVKWLWSPTPSGRLPAYVVLTPRHGQVAFRRADGSVSVGLNGPTLIDGARLTAPSDGPPRLVIRGADGLPATLPLDQARACAILNAQELSLLDASASAAGVHAVAYAASWSEDEVELSITHQIGDLGSIDVRYRCRDGVPNASD
jgi:hypothetical protein